MEISQVYVPAKTDAPSVKSPAWWAGYNDYPNRTIIDQVQRICPRSSQNASDYEDGWCAAYDDGVANQNQQYKDAVNISVNSRIHATS